MFSTKIMPSDSKAAALAKGKQGKGGGSKASVGTRTLTRTHSQTGTESTSRHSGGASLVPSYVGSKRSGVSGAANSVRAPISLLTSLMCVFMGCGVDSLGPLG